MSQHTYSVEHNPILTDDGSLAISSRHDGITVSSDFAKNSDSETTSDSETNSDAETSPRVEMPFLACPHHPLDTLFFGMGRMKNGERMERDLGRLSSRPGRSSSCGLLFICRRCETSFTDPSYPWDSPSCRVRRPLGKGLDSLPDWLERTDLARLVVSSNDGYPDIDFDDCRFSSAIHARSDGTIQARSRSRARARSHCRSVDWSHWRIGCLARGRERLHES